MAEKLGDTLIRDFITADSTGAAVDADVTPTCEVFEDDSDTAILSPTVTKRTLKTGNYRVPIAATVGNGFEVGKSYNVVVTATIAAVVCKAVLASFTLDGKRLSDLNDIVAPDLSNLDVAVSSRAAPGDVMGKSPATLAPADCSGNLPAEVKAQDNIDFGALQKASLNAATPASVQNLTQGATKAELDAAQAAIVAVLTAIKGAGWTTETLKAIKEAIASSVQIFGGFSVTVQHAQQIVTIDGSAVAKVNLKIGEAKDFTFLVRDQNKNTVDLSDATLEFGVKQRKSDTELVIMKEDADFDKSLAASGLVSVHLDVSDTESLSERDYIGELRSSWNNEETIVKSSDITISVKKAVTT